MKKTLIALAAVAATGAAFAQSSVTLYGVLDIGYGMKKWSAGGETVAKGNGVIDGAMAGNRFGFRGTEDLGGGLKAEFVIEQGLSPTSPKLTNTRTALSGFQPDTATGTSSGGITIGGRLETILNRQSYVGLNGGFGTVRLGYQYTNLYELGTLSGLTQTSEGIHGGDFAHLSGFAWVGGTRANGITYITPSFSGLTVAAQYGGTANTLNSFTHEIDTAGAPAQFKNERMSVMAKYAAGPLVAAVAHTSYKNGTAAGGATLTTITGKVTQLGASYDLGMAKLGATFNKGTNGASGAAERDVTGYGFGVTVPMGAINLIAGLQREVTEDGAGVDTAKKSGWQLGATYGLSKRTTAYVYTGTTKDTVSTLKQNDFVVGVRHTF